MPIKIMVADDHDIFRRGLVDTLQNFDEVEVIGEACNGVELINLLKFSDPNILLLDIEMPMMNGYEVMEKIKMEGAGLKVIIISMYDECRTIVRTIKAGARGFLAKSVERDELYKAIQTVEANGFYFNERISRAITKEMTDDNEDKAPDTKKPGNPFSDKELQILRLLAAENTSQEIAEQISISVRTVDGIRQRMIQKAGAKNVIGLFMFAFQHELL